jgi:hypothetical protein
VKTINISLSRELAATVALVLREAIETFDQEFWTCEEEYNETASLQKVLEKQVLDHTQR